ncbi:MAG: putative LPS assembly protein LptD [Bacteroidales bacterium]|nr:putative LPS assembly protein LptD [Bacteroidales bacterium]
MHKYTKILILCLIIKNYIFSQNDTTYVNIDTTLKKNEKKKNVIEEPITYKCSDSLIFDLKISKAYLYNNSEIKYKDMELKSYYIEIDLNKNEAYSTGKIDSNNIIKDKPVFKSSDDEFTSEWMKYNFKTKKGYVYNVFTEQAGGYLHSYITKKLENNDICVKNAKFTTCNLEHPHFYINLTKAKVIPNDKIVTGPAYLVIEDVPLPLGIPFGFFPQKKKNKSGIVLPEYGEEEIRGFFLKNGGYYLAINDYSDITITGDIYTNTSWGATILNRYKKRYKFDGNLSFSYSIIKIGEKDLPNYQENKAYYIRWNHNQDSKAHPYHRFSANVNIGSQTYNQFNTISYESRLRSSMQSSISYQQNFPNLPFNLSINLRHNQNYSDSTISLIIPDLFFSINRQNVLKKIYFSANSSFQNTYNTKEKDFIKNLRLKNMNNGIKHNIPISTNIKLFRYFTLSPSFNYTERWYFNYIQKNWYNKYFLQTDTINGYLKTDTIQRFMRAGEWTFATPLNTQIYGFYMPTKTHGWFQGVRHLIIPTINFIYRPDYSKKWYYKQVQIDTTGRTQTYSIFSNNIFGCPPAGKYGVLSFSLNNSIEMKYKSKNDTLNKINKYSLLDQLLISTGYNIAADSMKMQPLSIIARTNLLQILNINFSSSHQWYTYDNTGKFINKLQWHKNKKIANLTNANLSFNITINHNTLKKQKKEETSYKSIAKYTDITEEELNKFIDFSVPWSFNISYSLNYLIDKYNSEKDLYNYKTVKSLLFSGDINITNKWKLSVSTGYDFATKKFTYTNLNIYRDLHCWEMRLSWVPFGYYKSYYFQINVKSSILQDLKLMRKKPFIDYF